MMNARRIGSISACVVVGMLLAPQVFAEEQVIPIWPGVAPGSEKWTQKEAEFTTPIISGKLIRNVVTPTLTVFRPSPDKANGTAMIICPGGAFRFHTWDNEGTEVAKWLASRGVTAFVLKYRLVNTGATEDEFRQSLTKLAANIGEVAKPESVKNGEKRSHPLDADNVIALAVADGGQAMKLVRRRAAEWGIAPNRIGLMGFSAGGLVTTSVIQNADAESRPSFAAAIYGGEANGGKIPADAPPLFIAVADDDPYCATGCVQVYSAWRAARRPVELHVFSKGGHGYSPKRGWPADRWIERMGDWLEVQGLLKKGAS